MKKFTYACVLGLVFCCALFTLSAEQVNLTLETALDMAREHNLSLQSQFIDVNQARRDVDTSWNLFIPSVNLSLSHGGQMGVFSDASTTISGLQAGLSVDFPLNLAVRDQLETYNLSYEIKQVTYAQAQAEIERSVTKLFFALISEKENLTIQERNIELAQKQFEKVAANYEAGFASDLDLLTAQLGIDRLLPEYHQAEISYEGKLLSLKALLGLALDADIVVHGDLPDWKLTHTLESLKQYISSTRTLQLYALNAASIESGKKAQAKNALTPTLRLSTGYTINTDAIKSDPMANPFGGPPIPTGTWTDAFQYSVSVIVPLDGHIPNSRTKVSLAKMDDSLRKLQLEREQTKIQLEQSLITQVRTLENLQKQMHVARSNLTLSQRVYEMNTLQYASGYVDYFSVEKAQQDVLLAEQSLLLLSFQYASALVDLAYDLQLDVNEL